MEERVERLIAFFLPGICGEGPKGKVLLTKNKYLQK
jgi:hypothetical protein